MLHQSTLTLPHDNSGMVALYQWQETVSERPVLHWAHANGFNGRTYEPLLTPLAEHFDIYAWDARGHGHTNLCAQSENMTGWDIYGRDLIAVLEQLNERHGQKIWLGGHSMGGFTSIFAAAERPDLVAGLILADPVTSPKMTLFARLAMKASRHSGLALAEMAKKRRAEWPDLATVKKAYSGRGAFATWRDGYLDAYLQGGLLARENSDMLHLACPPHWEAANFKGPQIDSRKYIKRLAVPFTLLTAERGSTTYFRKPFEKLTVDKKIEIVSGTTHFLPMEIDARLRDEIIARIGDNQQ
jgi:pimeloyl-ACP methyl ester carboxylesterase